MFIYKRKKICLSAQTSSVSPRRDAQHLFGPEGYFRFLCPRFGEMQATVNPRNNLAHCFHCQQNLNNIDLLITLGYDFRSAVAILERWLKQYETHQPAKQTPPPPSAPK